LLGGRSMSFLIQQPLKPQNTRVILSIPYVSSPKCIPFSE
jgi:hypothetical protein